MLNRLALIDTLDVNSSIDARSLKNLSGPHKPSGSVGALPLPSGGSMPNSEKYAVRAAWLVTLIFLGTQTFDHAFA